MTASEPTRSATGHLLAPLATALLAGAAAAATYQVFIRTSLGQTVDTAAMRGGDVSHPRVVEVLSRTLNGTSLASLVLVCLAAAAVGVLRKRIDLAVGAALLVLGANGTAQLLKMRLDRPNLDDFPAPNSFPSGHTVAAASVAFALILVLPHAVRGTVALAGAGYVTVIAVATVWAEWHRPSDTVAGLLIVLAWASAAAFVIRAGRLRTAGAAERASRLATLPLLLVGGVTAAAGLLGLGAVILSERVSPDLVSGRFAFLSGSACITAAVAAVFLVWIRLATSDRPAAVSRPGASGSRPAASARRRSAAGRKGSAAPGTGSAAPRKGSAAPGKRAAASVKGSAAPGKGAAAPGKGSAAPGKGAAAPGKGSATSGKGAATPGTKSAAT
jgi:membrane-associated phospholipid phosphatase